LVNIYEWLAATRPGGAASDSIRRAVEGRDRTDPAKIITHQALNGGDGLCQEALSYYCRILGSVAGNLALTSLAMGGVYLGGGIPPKILPMLKSSGFMNHFKAKGRFQDLLATIPVWVICNEKAALMGATRCALELALA
jgi:glucokinase